jgi:micrococcal nuclease
MYKCEITRVLDGDTVDVNIDLGFNMSHRTRIRLSGIQAPETRTKDLDEKVLGLAAKARMIELVEKYKGSTYVRSVKGAKGSFGRYLGTIFFNVETEEPIDCNQLLLNEGHAVIYKKK